MSQSPAKRRRRGAKGKNPEPSKSKSKPNSDDASAGAAPRAGAAGYKVHQSLLVPSSLDGPWFDFFKDMPGRNDTIYNVASSTSSINTTTGNKAQSSKNSSDLVAKYRSMADNLYRNELGVVTSGRSSSSGADERWVENTMKKGTLKDRIAATSVLVSTDPVHKFSSLDNLLSMAGCSASGQPNSRVAQMAAEALEDLFLNTLLPRDRKLINLEQRPFFLYQDPNKTLSPRILLLWRIEEMIKERYALFLNKYLLTTLADGLELNKIFAIRVAGTLLRSVPEGEVQTLGVIVNKLGDPGKKVAATAGNELRRVLDHHSSMQDIVAREVQQLAHRPQLSPRALYNCITFLNQLKLQNDAQPSTENNGPSSLPVSLVNTYFRMFDVAMKQGDEASGLKTRLLSALLAGVNRAYPYLKSTDQRLEDHIDALYRLAHVAPPSASTQALMLLFHATIPKAESDSKGNNTMDIQKRRNRFYRALFSKLCLPNFMESGKHLTMLFNLVYKAMKADTDKTRVQAMAKRLLCTSIHFAPPIAASSLFLIDETMKYHVALRDALMQVPEGEASMLVLNPASREPRGALVPIRSEGLSTQESASSAPMWEISLLSSHYHPSVKAFANKLGSIEYDGDPLRDFSLSAFLDKYSYKNPKHHTKGRASFAQRKVGSQKVEYPVNDPRFVRQQSVHETDNFFLNFFRERARREEIKGKDQSKDDSSDDENETFDIIEERDGDQVFDDWSTDSEEERFVENLAAGMMEEHSGNALVETLDDEDPDTNDWDDMYNEESNSDGDSVDPAIMVDGEESSSDSSALEHAPGDPIHDESDSSSEASLNDGNRNTKQKNAKERGNVFVDAEEFQQHLISGDRLVSQKRKVDMSQGRKKKKQKK